MYLDEPFSNDQEYFIATVLLNGLMKKLALVSEDVDVTHTTVHPREVYKLEEALKDPWCDACSTFLSDDTAVEGIGEHKIFFAIGDGESASIIDWQCPERGERALFVILPESSEGMRLPLDVFSPYTVRVEKGPQGGGHFVANALYLGCGECPFALEPIDKRNVRLPDTITPFEGLKKCPKFMDFWREGKNK